MRKVTWAGIACMGVAAVVLLAVLLPAYWGETVAQLLAFGVFPAALVGAILAWQGRQSRRERRAQTTGAEVLPHEPWRFSAEFSTAIQDTPAWGKILLVDENPTAQMGTLAALRDLGHEAAIVTGIKAVEACSHDAYDVVLLACWSPLADCLEAAQSIRRIESPRRVPIVAISPEVIGSELRQFRDAGVDDLLVKPVRISELERAIQRWLAVQAPAAPAPASSALPEPQPGPRA